MTHHTEVQRIAISVKRGRQVQDTQAQVAK